MTKFLASLLLASLVATTAARADVLAERFGYEASLGVDLFFGTYTDDGKTVDLSGPVGEGGRVGLTYAANSFIFGAGIGVQGVSMKRTSEDGTFATRMSGLSPELYGKVTYNINQTFSVGLNAAVNYMPVELTFNPGTASAYTIDMSEIGYKFGGTIGANLTSMARAEIDAGIAGTFDGRLSGVSVMPKLVASW